MDTNTEHESAGENDDYQGVSDSTMMVNAELDALLDPNSDTDNSTQPEHLQQTSDSEQQGTGRPEKKKNKTWCKGTWLLQKTEQWKKHKKTPGTEREKDKLKQKITEHKREINRLQQDLDEPEKRQMP